MSASERTAAAEQPRAIDRLKPAQRRRAVALALASDLLRDRPQPALVNTSGRTTAAPLTDDVVRLATFILQGEQRGATAGQVVWHGGVTSTPAPPDPGVVQGTRRRVVDNPQA